MTTRQRLIVWAWIAMIVLTCVFPLWHNSGYVFLVQPPRYGTVDLYRILLEWVAISALCGGLYSAWPRRKGTATSSAEQHTPQSSNRTWPRPTWQSLASDVQSLSDEDLQRTWKRRFMRPRAP